QADVAAAVDQADAVAGHARAELDRAFDVDGVAAAVGTAVDAEVLHVFGIPVVRKGRRRAGPGAGVLRGLRTAAARRPRVLSSPCGWRACPRPWPRRG